MKGPAFGVPLANVIDSFRFLGEASEAEAAVVSLSKHTKLFGAPNGRRRRGCSVSQEVAGGKQPLVRGAITRESKRRLWSFQILGVLAQGLVYLGFFASSGGPHTELHFFSGRQDCGDDEGVERGVVLEAKGRQSPVQ